MKAADDKEMKSETFEAIRDQAARDGRCLYIVSEEEGKQWFCAGGMERLYMIYADTDPYISIAAYRAYDPGVLVDEEDGRLVLWECTPGAFADLYQGWQCSLYALPEALFLKEPTNWKTTRVCTGRAPVVHEEKIVDAWSTLVVAARDGLCSIHEYTEGEKYKKTGKLISEDVE